jgi:hypothetical protein
MKDLNRNLLVIATLFLLLSTTCVRAQDQTIFPDGYKRNVVKWNLTPFLLWSKKDINISYERILSPYRSFSVNAGYFEMPSTGLFDSLYLINTNKKFGFSISGDYRFYFKNRNKHFAPDGLYWGIYSSYHYYKFENNVQIINNENIKGHLRLKGGFSILSAGVELGYQFAIKKRWTVDLVFLGPSLSMYRGKLSLTGDLEGSNEDYLEAIRDILIGRFPFLDELIQKGEFDDKGISTSIGYGMRYLIQIGYRF